MIDAKGNGLMKRIIGLALAAACMGLAAGGASAQQLKKITLVQTTTAITPTEAIVIGAVPMQLGYYKDEGLEVTMLQGNGPSGAAQVLQSGSAEFATTMPEAILQMREQGGDVVAIYTLTQDNGVTLAVMSDSPIQKLEDLRGKSIGAFSWASGGGALLIRSLEQVGLKENEYTKINTPPGPATATSLKSGQVDALILWNSAYAPMENSGMVMRYIDVPAAHQVAGYSLATTERYIKENPKVVEGICRAVAKGYQFTRLNPDAAIDLFVKQYPSYKPASLSFEAALPQYKRILQSWMRTAIQDTPVEGPAGVFTPERWDFTQTFYTAKGQLKGTKQPRAGYDVRFLNACNQFDRAAIAAAASSYKMTGGQ